MKGLMQYPGKTIDFYYFSGTGNTLLIVKEMVKVFKENKFDARYYKIEQTDPINIDTNHIIGLGFPVAAQGTYPFVWQFIKNLPYADSTPLFMIDTKLMYSGGVLGPVKKIVRRKGYIPIGAKEFTMPSNVFIRKGMNDKKREKINKALLKATEFARRLIYEKASWFDLPIYSDLMALISQSKRNWKFFKSLTPIRVDKNKCNSCGLCLKLCPVNNIKLIKYPEFLNNCILCMRCFAYCPKEAISFKNYSSARYRAVEVNELLE